MREARFVDEWCERWVDTVRTVGAKHFGRQARATEDFEVRLKQERDRVLARLASARESGRWRARRGAATARTTPSSRGGS